MTRTCTHKRGLWPTRNAAVQRRRLSPADIALCHSITSSARNRREVGIVSLIYKRLRWGCASGDLVLRFGREIAGVMSFVQLFFKRPSGWVRTLEGAVALEVL